MPLWKNSDSTSDDAKPKFITLDPNIDARDVIATNQGWVHRKTYTDQHGNSRTKDEILVAIRQLAGDAAGGKLAEATIVDVRWSALQVAAGGVANVVVTFNESVTVTGSPQIRTLAVVATSANAVSGTASDQYATYISGSTTNRLMFNLTTDANQAAYTVGSAEIVLNGGTIKDTLTFTANSDLTMPAAYTGANSTIGTLYSNT